MADLNYIPTQLNWVENNPVTDKRKYTDLCRLLYATLGVVDIDDQRFRVTTNFLTAPAADMQIWRQNFGDLEHNVHTLWLLCSWLNNPPAQILREDINRITGTFINVNINAKLTAWNQARLQQLAGNDENLVQPSLYDSFKAKFEQILLVCKFLVKKTMLARNFYLSSIKWTNELNNLRAKVSSMLLGQSPRQEAFQIANDLVAERSRSVELYREYLEYNLESIDTNSRVLQGIHYRLNIHFIFSDLEASLTNKTIFTSHHFVWDNQVRSNLIDPTIAPISSSLDETVTKVHSFQPDFHEIQQSKANRLKQRIVDFLHQLQCFKNSSDPEKSRATMLLSSIKFILSEAEQLSLLGIRFDVTNLGATRGTLEEAQIFLSEHLTQIQQAQEKLNLESKAASSELSKSLTFASLPNLSSALSWLNWYAQFKKLKTHYKSDLSRMALIRSSVTRPYERSRLDSMSSSTEMLNFLASRYANADLLIPLHLLQLQKMPLCTSDHILLRNYDNFLKTVTLLKDNNLLSRLDRFVVENLIPRLLLPDQRAKYWEQTIELEPKWKSKANLPTTLDLESDTLLLGTNASYENERRDHFLSFCHKMYEMTRKILSNNHFVNPPTEQRPKRKLKSHHTELQSKCPFICRINHPPYLNRCPEFSKISVKERLDKMKQIKNVCRRCLKIVNDFSQHKIVDGRCPNQKNSNPCFCGSWTHSSLLHIDSKYGNNKKFPSKNGNFKGQNSSKTSNFPNKSGGQFKRPLRSQRLASSTKVNMTHSNSYQNEEISESDVLRELDQLTVNLTNLTPLPVNHIQSNLTAPLPSLPHQTTSPNITDPSTKRHFITSVGIGRVVTSQKIQRVSIYHDSGSTMNFCRVDVMEKLGFRSFGSWSGIIESICNESPVTLPAYLCTFRTKDNQNVKIPFLGLQTITDKVKLDDTLFNILVHKTGKDRSEFVNPSSTCHFLLGLRSMRFMPRSIRVNNTFHNMFPDLLVQFSPLCEKLFFSGTFVLKKNDPNKTPSNVKLFHIKLSNPTTNPIVHNNYSFSTFMLFTFIHLVLTSQFSSQEYNFLFGSEYSIESLNYAMNFLDYIEHLSKSWNGLFFETRLTLNFFPPLSSRIRFFLNHLYWSIINISSHWPFLNFNIFKRKFLYKIYYKYYFEFNYFIPHSFPLPVFSQNLKKTIHRKNFKRTPCNPSNFSRLKLNMINLKSDTSNIKQDCLIIARNHNIIKFNFISRFIIPKLNCHFTDTTLNNFILEKLIKEGTDYLRLNCRNCEIRSLSCPDCRLINSSLSIEETNQMTTMVQNLEILPHPKPTEKTKYAIYSHFIFSKNPHEIFLKKDTNFLMAKQNSLRLRKKLIKNGLIDQYHEKIMEELQSDYISCVSENEYNNMKIEYFISTNYALKNTSSSTKCRITSNASFHHKNAQLNSIVPPGPNLLNSPTEILNNVRFSKIGAFLDLSQAYKKIFLPPLESQLLMFFWFLDPNNEKSLTIFKNLRLPFGVSSATSILELVLRKIIAEKCQTKDASSSLTISRFVDDIFLSAASVQSLKTAADDLEKTLNLYNFLVKEFNFINPTPTQTKFDHENAIKFLSLKICLKSDQIAPQFFLNPSRRIRGADSGPDLSIEVIKTLTTNKTLISRLMGKAFCFASLFIQPLLAYLKIYFSIVCKITQDWKLNIDNIDPKFSEKFKVFLHQLIGLEGKIEPLPRSVIGQNCVPVRFCIIADASDVLIAAVLYVIVKSKNAFSSRILDARTKKSTFELPANELCSIKMGLNLLYSYLSSIKSKLSGQISVICLNDSKSSSFYLNPAKLFTKIVIKNAANHCFRITKTMLQDFSFISEINFGYISSNKSAADLLTKLNQKYTVLEIINSKFYRNGPLELLDPHFPKKSDTFLKKSKNSNFIFNPLYEMKDQPKIEIFSVFFSKLSEGGFSSKNFDYQSIVHAWENADFSRTPCVIQNFSSKPFSKPLFKLENNFYLYLIKKFTRLQKLINTISRIKYMFQNFRFFKKFSSEIDHTLQKKVFMSLIFSHQHIFGLPKNINMFDIVDKGSGVKEISLRLPLDQDKFSVKTVPVVNPKDKTLLTLLISFAHTKFCHSTNTRVHFIKSLTKINLQQSDFGVYVPSAMKYIHKYLKNCAVCNRVNKKYFNCPKSKIRFYEYLQNPKPVFMSFISIDCLQVPLRLTSNDKVCRKLVLFCVNCLVSSYTTFYLMENSSLHSTKSVLQNIVNEFGNKINYLMLDSASEFVALKKDKIFLSGATINIVNPKQQMLSVIESKIKTIRKLIRSIFIRDNKQIPSLTVPSFLSLLILIKETLNSTPCMRYNQDTDENLFFFTPNHLFRGLDFQSDSETSMEYFIKLANSYEDFANHINASNQLKNHILTNLKLALSLNSKSFSSKYFGKTKTLIPKINDICYMRSDSSFVICRIISLNDSKNYATIQLVKHNKQSTQEAHVRTLSLLYRYSEIKDSN